MLFRRLNTCYFSQNRFVCIGLALYYFDCAGGYRVEWIVFRVTVIIIVERFEPG